VLEQHPQRKAGRGVVEPDEGVVQDEGQPIAVRAGAGRCGDPLEERPHGRPGRLGHGGEAEVRGELVQLAPGQRSRHDLVAHRQRLAVVDAGGDLLPGGQRPTVRIGGTRDAAPRLDARQHLVHPLDVEAEVGLGSDLGQRDQFLAFGLIDGTS
jgi:hypothetical protein